MIEPKQQILSKQVSEINKADYFVICALKQRNLSTFGSSGGVLKACNWNQVELLSTASLYEYLYQLEKS